MNFLDVVPIKDEDKKDDTVKKQTDEKEKPFELTPKTISEIIDAVKKIVGEDVVTKYFSMKEKENEKASKHDRKIVYALLSFLGSVIILLSGLTYLDKINGEALLFAIGGIMGYVFGIIERFIFGTKRSSSLLPH